MNRRQTQNLAPALLTDLLTDNAGHARPDGLTILGDQHARVVVEAHDGPVLALHLLLGAHHHRVPDVAAPHLVRRRDLRRRRRPALRPEVALLLHHHDDAVACAALSVAWLWEGGEQEVGGLGYRRTYCGGALHSQHVDAFDDGRAGVVDAVQ